MDIDLELTEKSAKNTQRWWKLIATIAKKRQEVSTNQFLLYFRVGHTNQSLYILLILVITE